MFKKRKLALVLSLMTCLIFTNPNLSNAKEVLSNKKPITIMYYCDADNDLEAHLLRDITEIKKGVTNEINVVTIVDRHEKYTSNQSAFGEDFYDTRLYEIKPNAVKRVAGGKQFPQITTTSTNFEANMGDAHTLKNFIDFCKEKYPADKYVLILTNHGGGPKTDDENEERKAICWDETDSNDTLYSGEISDVLTKDQSVDIFGLDACFMGNAEFAYQFHKGNGGFEADIMVACATSEWGYGWKYDKILDRLQTKEGDNNEEDLTLGGKEKYYSPKTVTSAQIGAIIVEEQRDSCENSITDQTLSCYDLSRVKDVKAAVDDLAISIQDQKQKIENLRGDISNPKIMHYFSSDSSRQQLHYPFFDLYDFAEKIKDNNAFTYKKQTVMDAVYIKDKEQTVIDTVYNEDKEHKLVNQLDTKDKAPISIDQVNIQDKAQIVMDTVDDMVLYSYGGTNYKGFDDGKHGLAIFFPSGDSLIYINRGFHNHFEYQYWYSPLDLTYYLSLGDNCYGKLKWCQDGINRKVDTVGNWFELLDSWYDKNNNSNGGYNEYQW